MAGAVDDEFDRSGVRIIGRFDQTDGRVAHCLTGFRCQAGSRALLDELLVATLHGAIAFPKVDDVSVLVGDDLHFDVPRMFDELLDVEIAAAERRLGLRLGLGNGRFERQIICRDAHSAPAAARRGFDQHGEADLLGNSDGFILVAHQAFTAGNRRDVGLLGEGARRVLVAEQFHCFLGRSDELDVTTAANVREVGVLCQKTVPGMDRLNVADFRGADDPVDAEVAVGRLGGTDAKCLVGRVQVGGSAVRLAIDGDRFDAHLAAGAKHPQCDFTAIGYQDTLKHRLAFSKREKGRFGTGRQAAVSTRNRG